MLSIRLVCVCVALLLVGLGTARPAQADAVLLNNSDILSGELQLNEVSLATGGGVVRVAARDVWRVLLGTQGGDVVELRTGRSLSGLVEIPTYTLRLPSGQSVVLERQRVERLLFRQR